MSNLPKLVILDRDNTLIHSSSNPDSPLYYVTELDHVVLKPGVKEACALLRGLGIPMVMATKQRCVGKGLLSRERVDLINTRVERLLGVSFQRVMVEEKEESKHNVFRLIWSAYHQLDPKDMHLFDDSAKEREAASALFTVHDGTNLHQAVCRLLEVGA